MPWLNKPNNMARMRVWIQKEKDSVLYCSFLYRIKNLLGSLQKKYDANYNPAIVFAEATTLKSEPKNSSEDVVTVHEGTKVLVLETLGNWKQVELSDKTKAWIAKDAIKEVKK